MRFMVLVKARAVDPDAERLASALRGFDLELAEAGAAIVAEGFMACTQGARLCGAGEAADEARHPVLGYWLVDAPSQTDVVDRFRRCPALQAEHSEIEIHRLGATEAGEPQPQGPARAAARLSPRRLKAVVDYIEANLEHDLRVGTIARAAGFSPSHFQVLFRQTVGMSAHRYVVRRRVGHAMQLLASGQMAVSEAALASGFCHQSHLARAMRRVLGKSPTEAVGRPPRGRDGRR